MAKDIKRHVQHIRGRAVDINGLPKLPEASDILEGEIAINFGEGVETLLIKNASGDIVTFSSDNYYSKQKLGSAFTGVNSAVTVTEYVEEIEKVASSALNDLKASKLDSSAYTEYWAAGTGNNAVTLKDNNGTASGSFSVAEGSNTTASNSNTHAEGYGTVASGFSSHAEGNGSKAGGVQSHAEGAGSEASGAQSHAEGSNTKASGAQSHAEGFNTVASSNNSHAEGIGTVASGSSSHAEGSGTKASGSQSHAEGYNTIASGACSHAEGSDTMASDANSHAEGISTVASGYCSHAEGSGTKAGGSQSHAEGIGTEASNSCSHAEGNSTKASGSQSHAEGYGTVASGLHSHAEGSNTKASGSHSHAEGNNTEANNQSEHASGQFNVSNSASTTFGDSGNTLFSVGNGESVNSRHNAFEIRQNGDIYIVNKEGQDVKLQDEIGNIDIDQVLDNTKSASTNPVSSKAVYSAITDNELVWTNAYVALSGVISSHTEDTSAHVTNENKTAWSNKVGYAAYSSGDSRIYFYRSNTDTATPVCNIDARAFIKDGMIDSVSARTSASTTVLVITWNTDAGKTQTIIDIGDLFEADNYYTTAQTSGATEISTALSDLDSKKLDASAYTPTDLTNYYTKSETSGATEISDALSGKVDLSVYDDDQLVIAQSLNELNANKLDVSAYTPTDLSNYYTKSETSGKTELTTALTSKSDTGHTHVSSGVTAMTGYAKAASGSSIATGDTLNQAIGKLEAYVDDLNSQSETVAAALNDLNGEIDDINNTIGDIETLLAAI